MPFCAFRAAERYGHKDEEKQLPPGEEGSPEKEETAEEKGVSRLKKLYRRIVKAMHPDLHPDQDEKTKELFKRAMAAYEEGDLQTLEEIAQIIDGDEPENAEDLLTALLKEKERLLSLIRPPGAGQRAGRGLSEKDRGVGKAWKS